MGIKCEINLNKPPDGAFYSGEDVSGIIKYELDEAIEMEKITVSLKGKGRLDITQSLDSGARYFGNSEVYVDSDDVIQEGKQSIQPGSYQNKFNFSLPQNIPPSFKYSKFVQSYSVQCKIKYYVRIKFERPGKFGLTKHYRKKITVVSTITPRLPMEPIMYGERSKLRQLFSSKTSTVIMKANILNSVIENGGKIEIQSEIENDTNLDLKSVEIKLKTKYTFKANGLSLKSYEDVPNCDSKTGSIKCNETKNIPIDITVPLGTVSLDHSKIVSRDYIVRITAAVPMPHKNVALDIPVQIGDKVQRDEIDDLPPTYWEVMREAKKDDDDDSSDDEAGGDPPSSSSIASSSGKGKKA